MWALADVYAFAPRLDGFAAQVDAPSLDRYGIAGCGIVVTELKLDPAGVDGRGAAERIVQGDRATRI